MDSMSQFPPPGEPAEVPLAPTVEVEGTPPKKSRTGWVLGGLLALAAVVVGVVLVASGGDDSKGQASVQGFSLTAAAESAQAADKVAYEMSMDVGTMASINVDGRMDVGSGLMAMGMDMPGIGSVDVILDAPGQTMYMHSDAMASGLGVDTEWVKVDVTAAPGLAESLGQSTTNPLDASKVLLDPNNQVEDLGLEDFRGEQVRHYRVAVSTQAALDANPSMRDQMDATGAELPDTVEYDVFVNEASQLRRMYFELDMLGQTVSVEMVFTALDTIDPIVIPSADQVTDVTEMLADAMGG
ncbi:MAG: hypothetical protein H6513_00510 [Acidimicrobiaceae bacterium]|nr:hypothetical protein [Ilumatobacter sp.]MCB9379151.1 hypothetical protein [Acidimicrobiaceae bacterium]MCO5330558.1 hypothetical protein [Ilumatobacteraceae bacterium]